MVLVSRADVVSTHIATTPNDFIKIPIDAYLDELDIEPIPSQIALINAVNRYRFVCAALSRRQGKTYIANIIGQCVALVPGSNILVISPNYNLSTISWDLQQQLIRKFGLEVVKNNAKDKVIELTNGSTIRMGSINQVNSVIGRSYDLIIFDEAAVSDEAGRNAFNIQLRPTLDRNDARTIFISTPRGKSNWFSDFYQRGFSDEPKYKNWCSIHASWKDNPRMSESDVEEARGTMSLAEFAQEYDADFRSYEGQIWKLPESCIKNTGIEPGVNTHKMDFIAGLDLGFKDPTAMCVIGYHWEEQLYYVVDEYRAAEKLTSAHAKEIKRLIDKWNIDFIYIDSAAQQTRFDFAREYDIATINARKSVLDGIGHVGSLVDNEKLIVDSSCVEVIKAFDAYQWDSNVNLTMEKPLKTGASKEASHMADAIRYALYSHVSDIGPL